MPQLKMALIAVTALSGAMLSSASAMPVSNLAAAAQESSDIQNVRVVCGPFRCWWQPNYYYYPRYRYWGPRYHWWYRRWWWHRRW
jgi:hypothetical protein